MVQLSFARDSRVGNPPRPATERYRPKRSSFAPFRVRAGNVEGSARGSEGVGFRIEETDCENATDRRGGGGGAGDMR